jgi:two-component system, LytTR family, response regulator
MVDPGTDAGAVLAEAARLLSGGDFPLYVIAGGNDLPRLVKIAGETPGVRLTGSGSVLPERPEEVNPPPEAVIMDLAVVDSSPERIREVLAGWGDPGLLIIGGRPSMAAEAFRLHAFAFLIDPVTEKDLSEAIVRLRTRGIERRAGRISASLLSLLERRQWSDPITRFPLRSGGRISFLRADEIDWMEADRDYVRFHVGQKKHLIRAKISDLERRLPGRLFARIHRSVIVNIDRIRELHPLSYGEYAVVLNDGQRLTLSRTHRSRVLELLTHAHSA